MEARILKIGEAMAMTGSKLMNAPFELLDGAFWGMGFLDLELGG